jgi:hypothetical protein
LTRVLRIVGALPDALVALGCLVVWIVPHAVGVHWVRQVVVAMLVEFLAVHSGAFFSGVLEHSSGGWRRVIVPYLLLASVYVGFAGAFALAFGTWWPLQAMIVLVGMKFWTLFLDRDTSSREVARQQGIWLASCAAYVIGAFLTAVLPVPELGIDAAAREAADLPGSGAWVEQPQRVVAFAMAYFALLAWLKLKLDPLAPSVKSHPARS